MGEFFIENQKEMITIPLEEYKELLRCKGAVDVLQITNDRLTDMVNSNMRLYCTLSLHPDANI